MISRYAISTTLKTLKHFPNAILRISKRFIKRRKYTLWKFGIHKTFFFMHLSNPFGGIRRNRFPHEFNVYSIDNFTRITRINKFSTPLVLRSSLKFHFISDYAHFDILKSKRTPSMPACLR